MTISALLLIVAFITLQQAVTLKDKTHKAFWLGLTLILVWKALTTAQ